MKNSFSKRAKAAALGCTLLATSLFLPRISSVAETREDFDIDGNWARLLQHSMYFYDANMCGTGVSENTRYVWRGDCHTYDAEVPLDTEHTNLPASFISANISTLDPDGDGFVDVSGGYHDAGDHVKFGLPEAYAATTIAWGYYEFRDSYTQTGQDSHVETISRYFCDYFMRSTFRDANGDVVAFCYQVGDGDIDHAYWQAPENDSMARPAWFAYDQNPSTDNVSETSAALTLNYLNFKDTDPQYAAQCLDYAVALYDYANSFGSSRKVCPTSEGGKVYYNSSKWEDDFSFASAWLYVATGDHSYLENIWPVYDAYAAPGYAYNWNDVWNGVTIVLGEISDTYSGDLVNEYITAAGKSPYIANDIEFWKMSAKAINTAKTGGIGQITPGGFFWLSDWGSARYNTAVQFCALVYDKYNNGVDKYNTSNPQYALSDWAKGQMEYLMGENPENTCYVVGYCANSARFPHHRACSGLTQSGDTAEHRYVLYGALCGGPYSNDKHEDITDNYYCNEVTIDYNAAFVGAAAGLYAKYGDASMAVDEDFPPDPSENESGDVFGGEDYWVSGFYADDMQSTGAGVTKLTFYVYANSTSPRTDVSIRYYFDASELSGGMPTSSLTFSKVYDQVATEAAPNEAVISGPTLYNDTTYYIEVSWPGYTIANSSKKVQLILGYYYGENWVTSNDWSHGDMLDVGADKYDSFFDAASIAVRTDRVCVYGDGVLIGGIEPDGTTPTKVYKPASYLRLMKGIDSKKVFPSDSFAVQFDLNEDSIVNVADAVALKRLVLNS